MSTAIPAPSQCAGGIAQVHKYVNASAGIVTRAGATTAASRLTEQNDSPSPEGGEVDLVRQPVNDNHYDLSPGIRVETKPTRPPKPRVLSDTTTLNGGCNYIFNHFFFSINLTKIM